MHSSMTMMNRSIRTLLLSFSAIIVISSVILTTQLFVGVTLHTQKALGQAEEEFGYGETFATSTNATSGVNQTGASMQNQTTTQAQAAIPTPTAATTNQTAATPTPTAAGAQLANLTQADFETVIEDLTSAREGLQGLDNEAAFSALTSANNDLFGVISSQGDDRIKALAAQFKPVQTSIDNAQDALRNNDFAMALNGLTSADSELLKLTQQVPADEDDTDTDEDDETDEDDGG